ncbi:hypothetical protein PQR33_45850 [Paraburkholderia sediminicola]|uniref:hypothetical protein n=1 Tax=Paraburkholderia sediminicola TaxID=458836 RepID=UPI0038BA1016
MDRGAHLPAPRADVHARQVRRPRRALAARRHARALLAGIGGRVARRGNERLILLSGARSGQQLHFAERVRLACGLFGARAEVPLVQQNDLLVQVVNVADRVLVSSLERLLNALIDRLLMRRLLGMQQRLQRTHIAKYLRRQGRQRRCPDFRQRKLESDRRCLSGRRHATMFTPLLIRIPI